MRLQQRNDDGLGTGVDQFPHCLADLVLTQGHDDLALYVGAFGHPPSARQRHERFIVAVGVEMDALLQGIAEVGLDRPPHRMHVLETLVADEPDFQPLALYDAVEHRRARIHARDEFGIDVIHGAVPVCERVLRRVVDGERLVLGIALRLADDEAAILTDEKGVGHRAAGVDSHHLDFGSLPPGPRGLLSGLHMCLLLV